MKRILQSFIKYKGILLVLVLAAAACGCSKLKSQDNAETELAEGQRKDEIQVVSIIGNELTYIEVEEETETGTEAVSEVETGAESEQVEGSETEAESEQAGGSETGVKPEKGKSSEASGNSASDLNSESEMKAVPEGMGMPDGMKLPEGTSTSGDADFAEAMKGQFAAPVETTTVYLPVGVKVHTDNGKVVTFSILEAGDRLEVLLGENENGEEVITEIWLIGTE